jgi:nucleotide-binding universal stress UspA family protein
MKKILVPTDFSPTAEKAFRFAVNYASKINGTVILYHVYTPVESTFLDTDEKRRLYNAEIEKDELKRLQRLKNKFAGTYCATPIETFVGRAPITENILGFAEQNNIDLIVMGTQGATGLKKVIIGSQASRIAEECKVPVLLIPEKFEWKEPEKIVFATNYDSSDIKAINLSIELAKAYNSRLTVVHLFRPTAINALEDKEMVTFKTVADHLQKSISDFPVRFESIRTPEVDETLENLHQEISYDMLVMVRRNKGFLQNFFLKSFTKALCYVTKLPLLIVPANYPQNQ